MKLLLKNNIFIFMMLIAVIFSLLLPTPGIIMNDLGFLKIFTFIAMFISGLSLSISNIKEILKTPLIVMFSIFTSFFIFPLFSYIIASVLFKSSYDIFVGTVILSSQASAITSAIVLTMSAKGNVSLAVVLTVINSLISPFLSPIIIGLVFPMETSVQFDIQGMIINLFMVVTFPIILAQLFLHYLPGYINKTKQWRKLCADLTVIMFVIIGASSAAAEIKSNLIIIFSIILYCVSVHISLLIFSYLFSIIFKVKKFDTPAILFCTSQKTMTTSTMIWGTYFQIYALAPLVFTAYNIIQILIDSFIASRISKRGFHRLNS